MVKAKATVHFFLYLWAVGAERDVEGGGMRVEKVLALETETLV